MSLEGGVFITGDKGYICIKAETSKSAVIVVDQMAKNHMLDHPNSSYPSNKISCELDIEKKFCEDL